MDVLVSGSEPGSGGALRWLRRRQGVTVPALVLAVAGAATALAGGVVAADLRAEQRLALRVSAERATFTDRGGVREGVLELRVVNDEAVPLDLRAVELDVAGVRLQGVRPAAPRVLPDRTAALRLDLLVLGCEDVQLPGVLRLRAARDDEAERVLEVPVGTGAPRGVDGDFVAAGCLPVESPEVVALAVDTTGGSVTSAAGVRCSVALQVTNLAAPVELVAVTADVPGVLFVSEPQAGRVLPAGERAHVPLAFVAPFCPAVGEVGRVVVTVRDAAGKLRDVGYRVRAQREARVARDVHLDAVFDACLR